MMMLGVEVTWGLIEIQLERRVKEHSDGLYPVTPLSNYEDVKSYIEGVLGCSGYRHACSDL